MSRTPEEISTSLEAMLMVSLWPILANYGFEGFPVTTNTGGTEARKFYPRIDRFVSVMVIFNLETPKVSVSFANDRSSIDLLEWLTLNRRVVPADLVAECHSSDRRVALRAWGTMLVDKAADVLAGILDPIGPS